MKYHSLWWVGLQGTLMARQSGHKKITAATHGNKLRQGTGFLHRSSRIGAIEMIS